MGFGSDFEAERADLLIILEVLHIIILVILLITV